MKPIYSFLVFITLIGFSFCADFVDPDISDREVILLTPGDSAVSDSTIVTFFWEELDELVDYNLQIVEGDFAAPDFLVVDTIVSTNKITLRLDSGEYTWGVRAINESYESDFSVRYLKVVQNRNIFGQLRLIFPQQGQVLSDTTFQFSWQPYPGVDQYLVRISPGFKASEDLLGTLNTYLVYTFKGINQEYTWQVVGLRESDNAAIFSPEYTFTIQR